jgi:hypothetical protein
MERKFLSDLGLGKEVIDKILDQNGTEITALKTQINTKNEELKTAREQLGEANETINGFKAMDIESIKKAADDWKQKAEKAESDAAAKISQIQFDSLLESTLSTAKAKNAKAVKALLDMEGLKLDDGKIIGLDDQLAKIKAENDYLFEGDKKTPQFSAPTPGVADDGMNAIRAAAGLKTKE